MAGPKMPDLWRCRPLSEPDIKTLNGPELEVLQYLQISVLPLALVTTTLLLNVYKDNKTYVHHYYVLSSSCTHSFELLLILIYYFHFIGSCVIAVQSCGCTTVLDTLHTVTVTTTHLIKQTG